MRPAPRPSQVNHDLYDAQQLIGKLGKEYAWAYPAGYLGVGPGNSEPIRHVGASDPVGEIVCSKRHIAIRNNNAQAAQLIHKALLLLRQAGDCLLANQRDS